MATRVLAERYVPGDGLLACRFTSESPPSAGRGTVRTGCTGVAALATD